jgi:arabinogalactan endo-1,4-beta-galactosidase
MRLRASIMILATFGLQCSSASEPSDGRNEGSAPAYGNESTQSDAQSNATHSSVPLGDSSAASVETDSGASGLPDASPPIPDGSGAAIHDGAFPFAPTYILGADISYTLQDEAAGAQYSDGGQVKPIERILADNGFNFVRLRTFVNPQAAGGYSRQGFCDTAHTITMAKRVKSCGMGVFLDFHMSDTWASIGEQHMPSEWVGMTPAQIQAAAHDYVKKTLDEMTAAGVEPDMVQVGNETNSGMSGVSMNNWAEYSGLVNAAIRAVRETDPRIVVFAQHGRPRPDGNFEPWVDKYLSGNPSPKIDEDAICGSTYGTNNNGADWTEEFQYVITKYGKPVMSCEYSDDKRDLLNGIMHGFKNQMGRGTFLWEPTRYPGVNDGTLFTKTGNTYATNAAMTNYPKLARSYGLPVPSGTCR